MYIFHIPSFTVRFERHPKQQTLLTLRTTDILLRDAHIPIRFSVRYPSFIRVAPGKNNTKKAPFSSLEQKQVALSSVCASKEVCLARGLCLSHRLQREEKIQQQNRVGENGYYPDGVKQGA